MGINAVAPHSSRTAAGTSSTAEEVSTIRAGRADCGKRSGHRVAVAPRQIDVNQHPVRTGADDSSEGVLPVRCRIDDFQASQHEQLTYLSPEVLVVIDNQNPNRHPHSLVRGSFAFHGANPTILEALVLLLDSTRGWLYLIK